MKCQSIQKTQGDLKTVESCTRTFECQIIFQLSQNVAESLYYPISWGNSYAS